MAKRRTTGRSKSGGGHSCTDGFRRMVHYRIIVPLKRSMHAPEHTARGVAVGLIWAFTPTVGIQMGLVFITWLISRKLFRWDFSVIIGMAWTWVTNVVTMVPIYYVFYLTGQVLIGRPGESGGYAAFVEVWDKAMAGGVEDGSATGSLDWFWYYFTDVLGDWGLSMVVGCIPWTILIGWLGYVWSLRFVRHHREAKHRRRLERLARDRH